MSNDTESLVADGVLRSELRGLVERLDEEAHTSHSLRARRLFARFRDELVALLGEETSDG